MPDLFASVDEWSAKPVAVSAPTVPAQPRSGALLRPYQLDVLERGRAQIGRGRRRGIIQAVTGAGKSFIIAELCRAAHAKGKRVLVLSDRRKLIKQIGQTLDRFGVPFGVLMSGSTHGTNRLVQLASRDTLAAWKARGGFELPPADIILIDECHKSLGCTYQDLLDAYPAAVVVGFTATPARGDGKSLGSFYQWLECAVPASQLIAEGWLVKPEVFAPLELAAQRKLGNQTRGLAGDPVAHWLRHAEGLPTIAFSRNKDESRALRDRFLAAGISAEHLDGENDDDHRDDAFDRLQAGVTTVLCTVKLCIEGIDIPEVAAALLWAPFGSLVEFYQACGRIMRPAEGKTRAVVLDHAGAAGIHGLPGDDVAWSLDESTTVYDRKSKDPAETTHYCKQCGTAFKGLPACPACGWRLPREKKQPQRGESIFEARDENLTRYDGEGGVGADVIQQARGQHWRRCIAAAVNKGAKASMAVALFSKKFGVPPWSAGVFPLPEGRGAWSQPAAEVFPGFAKRKGVAS